MAWRAPPKQHPLEFQKAQQLEGDADQLQMKGPGPGTDLELPTLEAARFVELACEIAGLDLNRLASRVRDRETAAKRRLVVTLAVERWRQKGSTLAEVLNKNPDVVSWWVGEGTRRRLDDSTFAAEVDGLDAQLSAVLISGSLGQ